MFEGHDQSIKNEGHGQGQEKGHDQRDNPRMIEGLFEGHDQRDNAGILWRVTTKGIIKEWSRGTSTVKKIRVTTKDINQNVRGSRPGSRLKGHDQRDNQGMMEGLFEGHDQRYKQEC